MDVRGPMAEGPPSNSHSPIVPAKSSTPRSEKMNAMRVRRATRDLVGVRACVRACVRASVRASERARV